jgi:hypothetical protein
MPHRWHLTDIAVFCDSDDTHTASISYLSMSGWNGGETRTGVFVPECRGRLGCTIAFGLTGI